MFYGAKYICCKKKNTNATYHRRGFQMLLLLSDPHTGQWISTSHSQMCTWPNTRQSYPAKHDVEQVCAAFSNANFLSYCSKFLQAPYRSFGSKFPNLNERDAKLPNLQAIHLDQLTYCPVTQTTFVWEWLENEVRYIKKRSNFIMLCMNKYP